MDSPLLYVTFVLALGIIAQWLAWRLRFPSILLLLAFGFIAGQFLDLKIDNYLGGDSNKLILDLVGLCVAIILFEGGLTLKFSELRQSGGAVLRMCTLGVLVSFVITTAFCMYALPLSADFSVIGLNWRIAAVLGAILVVTGPTVISPLLRHIKPSRKIGSIVKWEGIVVDPIGAIMAVLLFQIALADSRVEAQQEVLMAFGKTILVGGIIAFLLAKGIEMMLKYHLIPDFLHSVFILSVVAISFTASNLVQAESGLLTVTVMGIVLANQKSVSVKHILEFKENLRVLIISALFIVLSGRIEASRLIDALPGGIALLLALILVVRPLSVFLANVFSKSLNFSEMLFLSFLAPRGIVAAAVTSIFALEFNHVIKDNLVNYEEVLNKEILAQADMMEPIVFIVIVGTVTFYGLLAAPLARILGVSKKNPTGVLFAGAASWARAVALELQKEGHDVLMLDTNYSRVSAAKVAGIPALYANILSEYVEEEVELGGLGMLIATTGNDEVNSLATQQFIHTFGSANVWQLAPGDDDDHHTTAVAQNLRAQVCFPNRPNLDELNGLIDSGATVKKTSLSEQYTFEDFNEQYEDSAIVLFVANEKGLRPTTNAMKEPSSGSTLFFLVQGEQK